MTALRGVSVVVTRAESQSKDLIEKLTALGANVIPMPMIEVVSSIDGGAALRQVLQQTYDWIIVTSANTIKFIERLDTVDAKWAVIGSATAKELHIHGIEPRFMPSKFDAESFVKEFPSGIGRILIPQAQDARSTLAEGLRKKGWNVDVVEAYAKRSVEHDEDTINTASVADAIIFTSSSTVTNYLAIAKAPKVVVCIGPATGQTAEDNGLSPVIADLHTVDGILDVLIKTLSNR